MEAILHTGFLISLASYMLFWLSDVVQPGFVSRYVSVHVFLLSSLIFGFFWSVVVKEYTDHLMLERIFALLIGVLFVVLTWGLTEGLGVYRLPIILIVFLTPWMVYTIIRS